MRQFVMQILLFTGIGTLLAAATAIIFQVRPAPPIVSDAGDVSWLCYDERLKGLSLLAIDGSSHLCVGEQSSKVVITAAGLMPGEIYTAWLAYIDQPSACHATPCPMVDFVQLERPPLLTRFDVAVADTTRQAAFSCTMRGLTFAQGAQVQLLLASHGPALAGERRAHQILGARWPEQIWNGHGQDGVIARAHFTMRRPAD